MSIDYSAQDPDCPLFRLCGCPIDEPCAGHPDSDANVWNTIDLGEELAIDYRRAPFTVAEWNDTHDEEFHITQEDLDAFIATIGVTRCENKLCLARLDEGEHGFCLDCSEPSYGCGGDE